MRQLVTIQTVKTLEKIKDKDRILYASFENTGWKVIVGTEVNIGDRVVFIEADSILPVHFCFEFLRARCYSPSWNGYVIRNMKLAGLYSQGLVLPLNILSFFDSKMDLNKVKDGQEFTDLLMVRKYDPEEQPTKEYKVPKKKHPLVKWFWSVIYRNKYLTLIMNLLIKLFKKKDKYAWPSFLSKTDETRAQTLSYLYDSYAGEQWYSSEKVDGSSCTFAYYKKQFYVCSRNLRLKDNPNDKKNYWWNYAKDSNTEAKIRQAVKTRGYDICIQGELIGPSIQGNKYQLNSLNFYVFNVKNLDTNKYFGYDEMICFCRDFGFNFVPICDVFDFCFKNIDELLEYSKGMSRINPKTIREGVVLRPVSPRDADRGQSNMCSFKVINPDFDIKHGWKKE